MFEISTTNIITQHQVADLVVSAIEGGSNEWLGRCEPPYAKHQDYSEADRYDVDMIPRRFSVDEDEQTYLFNRHAIANGLQLMADEFPTDFNDLREGGGDAHTADVFMQCPLLGDVVYG
jgi:hypothetical protein